MSVGHKLNAVNGLLRGETPTKLAAELNVSNSTISDRKKNCMELKQQVQSLTSSKLKKIETMKSCDYEDLDEVQKLQRLSGKVNNCDRRDFSNRENENYHAFNSIFDTHVNGILCI